MFRWFATRWQKLAQRVLEKEIERLLQEREQLRAELFKANGGKPIRLPPEERAKLNALRAKLDPEFVRKHNLIDDFE